MIGTYKRIADAGHAAAALNGTIGGHVAASHGHGHIGEVSATTRAPGVISREIGSYGRCIRQKTYARQWIKIPAKLIPPPATPFPSFSEQQVLVPTLASGRQSRLRV